MRWSENLFTCVLVHNILEYRVDLQNEVHQLLEFEMMLVGGLSPLEKTNEMTSTTGLIFGCEYMLKICAVILVCSFIYMGVKKM